MNAASPAARPPQHAARHPTGPAWLGIAIGVLVCATVLGIGFARFSGAADLAASAPRAAVLLERQLRFEDRPDGSIAVLDAARGDVIDTIEPGSNGFLRSAVRGLARERKRNGLGPDEPFRLVSRADGRLTLEDPATRRRIDLEAFGPVNAAAFAKLLAKETS